MALFFGKNSNGGIRDMAQGVLDTMKNVANFMYDNSFVGSVRNAVSTAKNFISNSSNLFGSSSSGTSSPGEAVNNFSTELGNYINNLSTTQNQENEENRNFNEEQAAINRAFQSEEAEIQRNWYEELSNSAYQRSMADMKAAGLNPILAYSQGGAATSATGIPAGSAAAYTATGGDTLSGVLSSVADVLSSLSGASARKVALFSKIFKMVN